MNESMRVALLLDPLSMVFRDPLSLRVKWGDHAQELARELLGRGHSVRGFGAPPGLIPRSGEDAQPEDGAAPHVRGRLLQFRPDVVVAYDALSPAAMRGALAARRAGAALVLVEAALPHGGRWYERVSLRVGEWLWGPLVRRTTSAVVALDARARAQALSEGFESEHITVVPRGVEVDRFRPGLTSTLVARHRIRGRILLYVGRLSDSRGVDVLLAAFARTVGQRTDWSLVIAGDGPLRPRLRAMADRLGVGARVHWLARPRTEELPGLMGASTLLAVPARDRSVVGRQIGRAMACGLPVLASDLPRMRTLIEHEHSGLLVAPGDTEAWTAAVRQAAGSPVARKRWATNARRFAEEVLAWSAVSDRIESILLEARERAATRLRQPSRTKAEASGVGLEES